MRGIGGNEQHPVAAPGGGNRVRSGAGGFTDATLATEEVQPEAGRALNGQA
jgi:hypothetical protein